MAAIEWAWQQNIGSAGYTLQALAYHADEDGICFPGQKTLAAMLDVNERTVRDHLKTLEARNLLIRERQNRDNGSRSSDRYHLNLQNLLPEEFSALVRTRVEESAARDAVLPEKSSARDAVLPEKSSAPEPNVEDRFSYPQKTSSSSEAAPKPKTSSKKKSDAKASVPNERVEELVAAMGDGFGYRPIDGSGEWKYWRRIVVELERDYQPEPDDLRRRIQTMQAEFDGKGGPGSLIKYWQRFGQERTRAAPTPLRGQRPTVAEQSGVLSVVSRLRAGQI